MTPNPIAGGARLTHNWGALTRRKGDSNAR